MIRHFPLSPSLRMLGIVLGVAAAAGCTRMERFHGFAPSEGDLESVQVGQTTKDAVLASFGPPVSDGTLDNNAVYYVSSRFEFFGPFAPEETDRQVVAIRFDGNDVVRDVGRYTLQDGQVVALDRRVTEGGINDVTLLGQLLRSFGRFNAATILGEEPQDF
ncbi:outer membrane protein assembly factor BamE [Cognatiyoonia sp. IB215446]|uniref:outer membrane protein assembly factor BamE n=1 Tax=Cognatiyoonia sp. IB215446 TaxID=3097355 RepID=UPI002A0EB567|nr:outer membrane protein assembly factor BamE [Cognatiyoonia sp. IB215446]MDX8349744.1 outer membrane protein assembly factor BamE [Cognatiyoonia sp. IB215446]